MRPGLGLTVLLAVSLACGWLASRAAPSPALFEPVTCPAARQSFDLVSSLYPEGNVWDGVSARLFGPGVLARDVCAPGTLRLRAHGTAAGASSQVASPRVTVSLDGRVLDDRAVLRPTDYAVNVPHAGHLSVAYLNDRYVSRSRSLTFWTLRLSGKADCGGPLRLTPQIHSGIATWSGDTGTLYGQVGLPLRVCGSGALSLSVTGGSSDGQRPHLRVVQGQTTLLERDILGLEQLRVEVPAAGTVTLELTNGFFQEVADRNVWIDRLIFDAHPE